MNKSVPLELLEDAATALRTAAMDNVRAGESGEWNKLADQIYEIAAAPKPEVTIIARPEHAQAINETAAQQVARPIEAESGSINPAGAAATLLNRGKK